MNILYETTSGRVEMLNLSTSNIIFSIKIESEVQSIAYRDSRIFIQTTSTFEIYNVLENVLINKLDRNISKYLFIKSKYYKYLITNNTIFELELDNNDSNHLIVISYTLDGHYIAEENYNGLLNISFYEDRVFITQDNKLLVFNNKFELVFEWSFGYNINDLKFSDDFVAISINLMRGAKIIQFMNITDYSISDVYTFENYVTKSLISFVPDNFLIFYNNSDSFIVYRMESKKIIKINKTEMLMATHSEQNSNYMNMFYNNRIEVLNLYSGMISDTINLPFKVEQVLLVSNTASAEFYMISKNKYSELYIYDSISRTYGIIKQFNYFKDADEKISNNIQIIDEDFSKDVDIKIDNLLDFF